MKKLTTFLIAATMATTSFASKKNVSDKTILAGKKNVEFTLDSKIGEGQFSYVTALAVNKKDYLIVSGAMGGKPNIVVFSPAGKEVTKFEISGYANSCCADDKGNIYVGTYPTKTTKSKVYKYSAKGKLIKEWNELDSGSKTLQSTTGMNTYKGHIYVADTRMGCLHKFTLDGKYVTNVGKMREGKSRGEFSTCCGILDFGINQTTGDIFVGNLGRHQVSYTKNDGKSFRTFGKRGSRIDEFCGCCNPVNMALTQNGYIVTAEKTIPRIKIYDQKGNKMIAVMGQDVFDKSCGNLDIAVDSKCNIYAVNSKAKCVVKFSAKPATK